MTEPQADPGSNGADPSIPATAPGVAVETVGAESLKPIKATCVTPEEVLLGENYSLRVMNLSLQKQVKEAELAKLEARIQREQQEMMLYRQKLSEKYDIDFTRYEIEAETGIIRLAGQR